MKRTRRLYKPGSLIAPMIDLFVLSLCSVIVSRPEFGLHGHTAPDLEVKKHGEHGQQTGEGPLVVLKADGTAMWNNQPTRTTDLPQRVATEAKNGQVVRVVVETAANGTGPARAMLELQMECGRLGVADRLRLLYRPHEESP